MITSVVYPAKAAQAIGYLKSSSNDIEVYVEDSSNPNMWVKLLRKYLPSHIRLTSVTPLHGRKGVIDACKADQAIDGRRKIYIIDGDLDLLQGKSKPNLKHLYRLRAYCVENYLLGEEALIEVATIFDGKVDEIAAKSKLDYTTWSNNNSPLIEKLFVAYAVSDFVLSTKIETVGFDMSRIVKKHPHNDTLCPQKTHSRIYSVYRETRKSTNKADVRACLTSTSARLDSKNILHLASGKDCIMPLIYARMKNLFKLNVNMNIFFNLLADKANDKFDPYLSRRLATICSENT
jgi:hypothetical protein